jgi:hypothetical protein
VNGRIVAGGIVLTGLVAGVAMYWLQVHAFYTPAVFAPGQEITLTPIGSDQPEAIVVEGLTGIDANSSPLRFRACFTTPLSLATLTETYRLYDRAVPLNAPGWFDCFDAQRIGQALERGEALAFLSQAGIAPGVDRVVAVFPDGSAFAWHQLAPGAEGGAGGAGQ